MKGIVKRVWAFKSNTQNSSFLLHISSASSNKIFRYTNKKGSMTMSIIIKDKSYWSK